ncbi:MAG: hypothetical protein ACR2GC_00290 [Methyloceanibacter sp.]|uniref:hypothetical protein n=1 Tax=Methyloceanibacter sp. TaxID=1965321 RepID=UPI003D9B8F80
MTGLGVGYLIWGWPTNWYTADVNSLGPGAENDLIRYGHALVVDTPQHIGKSASDPAMRFGGNDLACQSCHLNAGLQPFAALRLDLRELSDDGKRQGADPEGAHQWLHDAEHERQAFCRTTAARCRR